MSPRLKHLSARELLAALRLFGFEVASTRGSHAKLCHEPTDGTRQILTIPLHRELAPGTLRAIFRQATRFIPADELRPHFFAGPERRQRGARDQGILDRDADGPNHEAGDVLGYQEDE